MCECCSSSNSYSCVAVNVSQGLPRTVKIGSQMIIDDDEGQIGTQKDKQSQGFHSLYPMCI